MGAVKSKPGLLNRFNTAPAEVRGYFEHLPRLIQDFPLDVCLSYVFAQLERAQNMTLYCGVVKLHRAESGLAKTAIDVHHMTRPEFKTKFETVFEKAIPKATSDLLEKAEEARDRVMHGKQGTDDEKRNAIANVLDYAEAINQFVSGMASFKPFGDLRGFKGAAQSLDKSTTRWLLKGMGFTIA
ncbi:MAG: hypothetical protein ACRD1B_07220 [Thermoanaerobaculia bacterium]